MAHVDSSDLPVLPDDTVLAALGRFATRYPQSRWLEVLALRASRGACGSAELVRRARQQQCGGMRRRYLAWFGYVLAASPSPDHDVTDILAVLEHALEGGDPPVVGARVWSLYLQALHLAGRPSAAGVLGAERLARTDPHTRWGVETDAVSPFLGDAGQPQATWMAAFSRPFTDAGTQPLDLTDTSAAPFDRLTCTRAPATGGDLVSVIMPVFNPDQSLLTAARSVLDQTWADLELLLCDDGSISGRQFIDEVAGMDERVRVLRSDDNAGAYSAQNRGLAAAQGRYITIHGADDFSHGQRIERHVAAMAETRAVATLSHSVRASARLELTVLGRSPRRVNLSSLLFERHVVLPALGGFDSVRRAGDTEFIRRIEAQFSAGSVVTLDEPLAVIQTTPDSLSRNDFGMLRRSPAREAYRVGFDGWHARIAEGTASAFLLPPARGPFPAPAHISGVAEPQPDPVDLVFLANPMANAPTDLGLVVAALADAGLRLGVVEFLGIDDVRRPPRPVGRALAEAVADGNARWVLPGETVTGRAAIVLDPQALLLMPGSRLADVHVEHLLLAAARTDVADPGQLRVRAAAAGIPQVHWLPANEAVASTLREHDHGASVLPPVQWHLAPPKPSEQPRREPPAVGSTAVGMVAPRGVSRQSRQRWVDALVPRDARTALQCYGRGPATLAGREISAVAELNVDRQEFLDQVHFLLAPPLPLPQLTELVVAAWARGVVVLAQESMRPHLGNAALYPAGPSDALIARLQADPDLYRGTQRVAADWVRAHASSPAVVESVRRALTAASR